MTKTTYSIIEETIEQMTIERKGILDLFDNMQKIARRAEVSLDTLKEYFFISIFDMGRPYKD